jgi:hypothetical protein
MASKDLKFLCFFLAVDEHYGLECEGVNDNLIRPCLTSIGSSSADAHINLANSQCDSVSLVRISASLLSAAQSLIPIIDRRPDWLASG